MHNYFDLNAVLVAAFLFLVLLYYKIEYYHVIINSKIPLELARKKALYQIIICHFFYFHNCI